MCDGKRRLEGNVGLRVWQLEGGLVFQLLSLGDQEFFFSFPGILVHLLRYLVHAGALGCWSSHPWLLVEAGLPGFRGPRGTGVRLLPGVAGDQDRGVSTPPLGQPAGSGAPSAHSRFVLSYLVKDGRKKKRDKGP